MILDENEKPMVAAHVCWNDNEATIIQSVLRDGGVESQLNSEVPHSVLPIKTASLGKVEVLVRQEDLPRAKEVLASHLDSAKDQDTAE